MKKLFIYLLIFFISYLSAWEEVLTTTTVTQDTTVTIIEPPATEAPDEPEESTTEKEPEEELPTLPEAPEKSVVSTQPTGIVFHNDIQKNENDPDKEMVFTVTFTSPLPKDVEMVYFIVGLTDGFTLGSDIDKTESRNYITAKKGATSAKIKINVIDDKLYESNEQYKVVLKAPSEYVTYDDGTSEYNYVYRTSYGTIIDDDIGMRVDVSVPDMVSLSEKDADTKDMEFVLNFSQPLKESATLKYEIIPNDITLGKDIQNTSAENYITLNQGDTSKKISIKVLDDNLYEQTEYFQIKYYPPNSINFLKSYSNGEILDDEMSVTISDYVIFSEDEADKSKMKFSIAFSKELPEDLTLEYTLEPGNNLTLGEDIENTLTTGSIVVKKGAKNATIEISVLDDDKVEDAEYFTIKLKQPSGNYGMINDTSIGVILDDDVKVDTPTSAGSGDYVIYEYETTDTKLKTKIVNTGAKFDVYASEGFEIFLGETQEDEKTCDEPDCSIVTLPTGQQVQQCITTCYITTTTVLKYSDAMNIDEIVLRTFKEYDADKKQCYAEYPKQVVAKDINLTSGAKYTFSIPTDKAFRCGWIEITGHSEEDVNGTVTEFKGVSDTFAMRPNSFKIDLEGKSLTNPLKSGEDIELKVMAVDPLNNLVNSYSGKNFIEKVTDKFFGESSSFGLNINGESFISGMIKKTTNYSEVGELTITVEESSPAYAQIDKDDNPTTYKITPASYQVRVIPDHFKLIYTLKDFDEADKLTFIANTPTSMGAALFYTVEAQNKMGIITRRYTSGKYADNVNLNIHQATLTSPTRNLTLLYEDSKGSENQTFDSSSVIDVLRVINESDFSDGRTMDTVFENFARDSKEVQNPIELKAVELVATEKTGVGGIKVTGISSDAAQKAFFYYARAHIPSPQTSQGDTLDAKIYYEVYCKNCDKSVFLQADNSSSIDSVYWYILPSSVLSNLGSSVCDYKDVRALDMSTINNIVHQSNTDLNVVVSQVPSKNKIFYTPINSYLQYNIFGTFLPEHFFEVSFSSASSKWAGEGTKGSTVDTNISKNLNQSLDW